MDEKTTLDILQDVYFQFGCKAKEGKPWYHNGCLSILEEIEQILLDYKRIEKYRKNGRMEWYKLVKNKPKPKKGED